MKSNQKKIVRALAVVLSFALVSWQSVTPLSAAFAAGFANDGVAVVAQEQQGASFESAGAALSDEAGADGVDGAPAGDEPQGIVAATGTSEKSEAAEACVDPVSPEASSSDDSAAQDASAVSPAAQIATQSAGNASSAVRAASGYNPGADPIVIDRNVKVGLYKSQDASGKLTDELTLEDAVTTDQTLYGQINIAFDDGQRPTLSNPNVSYEFPKNIAVKAQTLDLLDESGQVVGKTIIGEDGVVTLKYNEEYLSSEVQRAKFKFTFAMNVEPKGDGGQEAIAFPGTGTTVTVKTKDGGVSGDKKAASNYDPATGEYSWTIKVSPKSYATNLVVTDTLENNLSFVEGSFKLGHSEDGSDGAPVSAAIDASNPQKAEIALGNLEKGDYYLTYKTKVKQSALEGLNDGERLQNIGNQAKFTWGANGGNSWDSGKKYPNSVQYRMVEKQTHWQSAPNAIKWVVKLNTGSLKADMGGYVFKDAAGENQKFLIDADHPFTITKGSENGHAVTPASKTFGDQGLEFTFADDAGEETYYVTYYTALIDQSSEEQVSNTAEVESPDESHGPNGWATGYYNPPSKDYISKKLNAQSGQFDADSYDGKASWTSTVKLGDMPENTDPSTIVFTDSFSNLPDGVTVSLDGDVVVKCGDQVLAAGTDYDIAVADAAQGKNGELIRISFKASDAVRALVGAGKGQGDVAISYSTVSSKVDASYPEGEYKNKSQVSVGDVSKSAEANYTIVKKGEPAPAPAVAKEGKDATWDATYEWGDGTKGAWISDWSVWVNRSANENKDDWSLKPAVDLQGADVTVRDTVPEGSEYVAGSGQYTLWANAWNHSGEGIAIEPAAGSDGSAIFTIPTTGGKDQWGNSFNTTRLYVGLTYQTATKQSAATGNANGVELTNKAQADCGDIHFDEGSATSKINSKVLTKDGQQDDALVKYTIRVNEYGLDLAKDSNTLKLVDTMDSNCLYAGALSVTDSDGNAIDSSLWSKDFENVTNEDGSTSVRMTLTLPDSTPLVVTYKVKPLGDLGADVNLTNVCSLKGVTETGAQSRKGFRVIEGSSETANAMYGIGITKYNAQADTKLKGAKFDLCSVTFSGDEPVFAVEQTGETDEGGKVEFGNKQAPLASNTLYCFIEKEAPEGYKVNSNPVYFVLKGSDIDSFNRVVEDAKSHGVAPAVNQTAFVAYNEKDDTPSEPDQPGDKPGTDNPSQPGGGIDQPGDKPGTDQPGDKPGEPSAPGTDNPGTPDKPDQPGEPDKPGQPEQPGDKPGTDNPGKPSTPDKPGTPDQPGTPDRPDKPSEPDQPSHPGEPDQPSQPGEPDQPGTPDQPSEPSKPGVPDNPDKPGQPDQPNQPGEPSEPSHPDQPNNPDNPDNPGENPGGGSGDEDHDSDNPGGGSDNAGGGAGDDNPGPDTPKGDGETPGSDVDKPADGGQDAPAQDAPKAESTFVRTSDPAMLVLQSAAGIAVAAACVIAAIGLRRVRLRSQSK